MLLKLFLIFIFVKIVVPLDPIINTTSGPIRGVLNHWNNLQYFKYLGIPYAENPTGERRFMPPVPIKPWTEVLNATQEGASCPQGMEKYSRIKMNENCLYLNIYVPLNATQNKLSVLVFLHGGKFRFLSGNSDIIYGPQLLLERGVIFVSMNYRLGSLGFLSLDAEGAPGNAALKDVVLSLKWINDNIESFGGDRNQITIGGHSSGATMIHYLLISKQTVNLFQRAIMISGSVVNPRSLSRHPKDNVFMLAKELGLQTNDEQYLLKKLKEINVYDIIDAEANLTKYDDVVLRPFSFFLPTVEKESSHAIITSDPSRLSMHENIAVLSGFNEREGLYAIPKIMSNVTKMKKMLDNIELCIPSNIEYPLKSKISLDLGKSIKERYFNRDLSNFTMDSIVDLASDSQFIYGIDAWMKKNEGTKNNLYYYMFSFDGDLNWAKINYNINYPGTAHADELGYIFVTNKTKLRLNNTSYKSQLVLDFWTTLLCNFIKFGNPTPENFTGNFKWPKYQENGSMLILNDNPREGKITNPLLDRLKFWYDVYEQYDRYVKDGGKLEKKCIP